MMNFQGERKRSLDDDLSLFQESQFQSFSRFNCDSMKVAARDKSTIEGDPSQA